MLNKLLFFIQGGELGNENENEEVSVFYIHRNDSLLNYIITLFQTSNITLKINI
jgi:hypothetical protein